MRMIFFVKKKINTIFRLFYLKRYYDLYFGFQYFEQEKLRKFQINQRLIFKILVLMN